MKKTINSMENRIKGQTYKGLILSSISIFIFIFSISFISAESMGYGKEGDEVNYGANYSINVNNSNYLQGYTPLTLRTFFENTLNNLVNYYSKTDINNFNASYLNTTNTSYVPYTGANQNVDLGNNNLIVDTNTLFIDSANNRVGIGTTSPNYTLEVVTSDLTGLNIKSLTPTARPGIRQEAIRNSAGGLAYNLFESYVGNVANLTTLAGTIGIMSTVYNYPTPPTVSFMYFGAANDTAWNDNAFRLYPDNHAEFSGNVGIGTIATPTNKLVVNGSANQVRIDLKNAQTTGVTTWSAFDMYAYDGSGINAGGGIIHTSSSANWNQIKGNQTILWNDKVGGLKLMTSNGSIVFHTGGINYYTSTERMKIDSNGNVGIGTTNPFTKLHVNGSILANGTINATSGFGVNGNSGLTTNRHILNSSSNACWINYTGGLMTWSDC